MEWQQVSDRKVTANNSPFPFLFILCIEGKSKIQRTVNKYKAAFLFFASNKYSEQALTDKHVQEKRSTEKITPKSHRMSIQKDLDRNLLV